KDNDYKAYREKLAQKLDSFRGVGQGTIVIPWMQPHYEEIKSINQSYTSGKSGDSSENILSSPGALKLTSIFALLEQCKTNTMAHDDEEWNEVRKHVTSSQRHRDTITVDGITITIPSTLSCLGCGDLGVGQYDIGSDDGGDNMEIGTSSKHVFASNSAPPLTKVSQNNSGEQSNETLESLDTPSSIKDFVYTSSNEQTIDNSVSTSVTNEISKTVENGKPVGKSLEETSYNLETVKNDSASGFSNGKSEGPSTFSSKTSPISIPQQSQKEIQL
ncbi:16861_t:CDS:2, partial [Racocetra fulgida]